MLHKVDQNNETYSHHMIHRQKRDIQLGNITMLRYDPIRPLKLSTFNIDSNDLESFYKLQNSFGSEHIINNISILYQESDQLILAQ